MEGKVKWFNDERGYGFIRADDGSDVFVHRTGINSDRDGNRLLSIGDRVSFTAVESEKGLRAEGVVIL